MHGANIAADNPMMGVAPEAIANAVDNGIDTRATVIPGPIFSFINFKNIYVTDYSSSFLSTSSLESSSSFILLILYSNKIKSKYLNI